MSSCNIQDSSPLTKAMSMQRVRVRVKGQGHRGCINFFPQFGISGVWLKFEFTACNEMMHKNGLLIKEASCYLFKSSVKFKGATGDRSVICICLDDFRTMNPTWMHGWLINDQHSFHGHVRFEICPIYCWLSSSGKFWDYTGWPIPDNSVSVSINNCIWQDTELSEREVHIAWSTILQGHPSYSRSQI